MQDHEIRAVLQRYDEALGRRDVDALADLMTEDTVWEDTSPPEGRRQAGRETVLDGMRNLFADEPQARFETEEIITAPDRAVVRWHYTWGDGHVRGVDVLRFRDGRIAETLSYVKG